MNDIEQPVEPEQADPRAIHERLEAEREQLAQKPPEAEGLPEGVIGAISITFHADGNTNVGMNNIKVPQMFAAGRLLDTIATRMWNEQRDMMLMAQQQQEAEVQAALRAIRQPTDFMGKGGRRRS
jgi:hypothetical protein